MKGGNEEYKLFLVKFKDQTDMDAVKKLEKHMQNLICEGIKRVLVKSSEILMEIQQMKSIKLFSSNILSNHNH